MTAAARLTTDEQTARRVAAFLGETLDSEDTVCAAFEDERGQWHVAIHYAGEADEQHLRELVALAAGDDAARALSFERVDEADWVERSLEGLTPVHAGRFVVHGAHDRAHVPANAIGIEIEAALAFGTGHHGTTRGCLLALDTLAKREGLHLSPGGRGRPRSGRVRGNLESDPPHPARSFAARHPLPRGERVALRRMAKALDIGTGSGVLAIAGARRLNATITASDIDRVAVDAARKNARLNRAPRIRFVHAAGASARALTAPGPYDLIFANILLGPLVRLARPIRRLAAPGAHVILSGLLRSHANAALAAYRAQGFVLERRIPLDGWMTLLLKRPVHCAPAPRR
jgi:ribosomal protein L11 methyltransferase